MDGWEGSPISSSSGGEGEREEREESSSSDGDGDGGSGFSRGTVGGFMENEFMGGSLRDGPVTLVGDVTASNYTALVTFQIKETPPRRRRERWERSGRWGRWGRGAGG